VANQQAGTSAHPGVSAQSDEALMAALCATDGEALAALFHRYHRLVERIARRILRDGGEAEDVTQEVFLEIYCKAHLYDAAKGSVRGWLLQYAYHRTLRRKAALRRRAAYGGEPLDLAEPRPQGVAPLLTVEECRWVLRAGLARLPRAQRATLELVRLHGLSLREVAARLGVSLGAARHYYYRGLAGLRDWVLVASELPPCHASTVLRPRPRRSRSRATSLTMRRRPPKKAIELVPGEA
jgi:RNA polymerase sigma-70 factor, ECF subfamily